MKNLYEFYIVKKKSWFIRFLYFLPSFLIILVSIIMMGILGLHGDFNWRPIYSYLFLVFFILTIFLWNFPNLLYKKIKIIDLSTSDLIIRDNDNEKIINIKEIENIRIHYNDYQRWLIINTFEKTKGLGNLLEFSHKGVNYSFEFVLESRDKFATLKGVILSWLNIGINVEYYEKGKRTKIV